MIIVMDLQLMLRVACLYMSISVLVKCSPVPGKREGNVEENESNLEAHYYKKYANSVDKFTRSQTRRGNPKTSHTCYSVRNVPTRMRGAGKFGAKGIDRFYTKYTEAYGIPVLGSSTVADQALQRACYVLRFFLAGRADLREVYYKMYGRVAVIGSREVTRDIPEYRHLKPVYNAVRGLGAVEIAPVTTVGEENVLCNNTLDPHRSEDILLRELAHGVHLMGARLIWKRFQRDLERAYKDAMMDGKWRNTYAAHSVDSYFAEGIQSYLDANGYSNPADGVHNSKDTAVKLYEYDPMLYSMVRQFFLCGNIYLKRCQKNIPRERENNQKLRMNCGRGYWSPFYE